MVVNQLKRNHLIGCLLLVVLIGTFTATIAQAESYVWEDYWVPFKRTFSFSTAEKAVVRVTIPADVVSASDRLQMVCEIDKNNPRLRPYLIVNNNRSALYYLGDIGLVGIRSNHLKAGENELLFGDQTTTGDLIFVYTLQFHLP